MQFAKPRFNTNASFRSALQGRVRPVQAMRTEAPDGRQQHSAMASQPRPIGAQQAPQDRQMQAPIPQTGQAPGAMPARQPVASDVQSPQIGQGPQTMVAQQTTTGDGQGARTLSSPVQSPVVPQVPQAAPEVMAQARDLQSNFTQMANEFAARPEVVALGELGRQLEAMDQRSPQAVDLRSRLEQARTAISQSPEYQQLAQANEALQQRVSDEQAFQSGYASQLPPKQITR